MRSSPSIPHAETASLSTTLRAGLRPTGAWRTAAIALLRLNARECEAIGLVFESAASDTTREIVLDLLAAAGTYDAQTVMRRLLSLAVARRHGQTFASFVQRLGSVAEPDGPTLRFLMSVYAESKSEPHHIRAACAYALGASAGQAYRAGDADAAVRASETLRRDLRDAVTGNEKCALVTAVGNAGLPTDSALILRFTADPAPSVRSAAAFALRKVETNEARCQLVALVADRDLKVAKNAALALADQPVEEEHIERLAELVLGGRTSTALDASLLTLIVSQRPRMSPAFGRPSVLEKALRLLLERACTSEARDGSGVYRAFLHESTTGPRRPQSALPPAPAARGAPSLDPRGSGSYRVVDPSFDPNATICGGEPNPFAVARR